VHEDQAGGRGLPPLTAGIQEAIMAELDDAPTDVYFSDETWHDDLKEASGGGS